MPTAARDLIVTGMWQSLLQSNSDVARMIAHGASTCGCKAEGMHSYSMEQMPEHA